MKKVHVFAVLLLVGVAKISTTPPQGYGAWPLQRAATAPAFVFRQRGIRPVVRRGAWQRKPRTAWQLPPDQPSPPLVLGGPRTRGRRSAERVFWVPEREPFYLSPEVRMQLDEQLSRVGMERPEKSERAEMQRVFRRRLSELEQRGYVQRFLDLLRMGEWR